MKKNIARIIALALAAVMVLALLTACAAAKPSGTYTLKTMDGKTPKEYMTDQANQYGYDLATILNYTGIKEEDLDHYMTLTFNNDGTGKLETVGESADEFKWEIKDKKLILTDPDYPDEQLECTFSGNTIEGDYEGFHLVFSK